MSTIDQCSSCDAHCCRHVAVPIDKPGCKREYDQIRWYLLHENIWVSIDLSGEWILEFRTPCRNIDLHNRCANYHHRPSICQKYPAEDELCEKQTDSKSYTRLFTDAKEFEKYLDKKKIDWRYKGRKTKNGGSYSGLLKH